MNQVLTASIRLFAFAAALAVVLETAIAADPDPQVGVFVFPGDEQSAKQFADILKRGESAVATTIHATMKEAMESDTETLVLVMGRSRGEFSDEIVEAAKLKKIVGVGYGSAQLFGALGLEINGGSCAHFGGRPSNLQPQQNRLLGELFSLEEVQPYAKPKPADNFGMYVPKRSDQEYVVDVIARFKNDSNYAPIVGQNNYVMIGLSAMPEAWSPEYQVLFRDVVVALSKKKTEPFSTAEFRTSPPGQYALALGHSRSTDHLFSKTYFFKFDQPTVFSATLKHGGSDNMMMLFMGEKNRLHWTREDAKDGETLRIVAKITAEDLKRIGDGFWTLKVTNFDRNNPATCVLDLNYELKP